MLIFAKSMNRNIAILLILSVIGCTQPAPSYPPTAGLSKKDLENSRDRTKNLNETERQQIEDWIKSQDEKFYPMPMNYWVNDPDLQNAARKEDNEIISYEYEIYDFDHTKIYDEPKRKTDVRFGKFEELKPIEDALRHLSSGKHVTLLIPSALGYGTTGDGDQIPNDLPLIIKLKVL